MSTRTQEDQEIIEPLTAEYTPSLILWNGNVRLRQERNDSQGECEEQREEKNGLRAERTRDKQIIDFEQNRNRTLTRNFHSKTAELRDEKQEHEKTKAEQEKEKEEHKKSKEIIRTLKQKIMGLRDDSAKKTYSKDSEDANDPVSTAMPTKEINLDVHARTPSVKYDLEAMFYRAGFGFFLVYAREIESRDYSSYRDVCRLACKAAIDHKAYSGTQMKNDVLARVYVGTAALDNEDIEWYRVTGGGLKNWFSLEEKVEVDRTTPNYVVRVYMFKKNNDTAARNALKKWENGADEWTLGEHIALGGRSGKLSTCCLTQGSDGRLH